MARPPPTQEEYIDEINRLDDELAEKQMEAGQAIHKNFAIQNLLQLEKTKRHIYREAIMTLHDYGQFTPSDLAEKFLLYDGGVDNFKRMLKYNQNYVSQPLCRDVRALDARLKYYQRNRRHAEEDGLRWDPETESFVPQ
jgi:hypothetical protein